MLNKFRVPVEVSGVERILDTDEQSGLSAKSRRKNMLRAFKAKKDFSDLRVAIVDDVVTTGVTANEIAKALKKANAAQVIVWACARSG